MTKRIIVLTIIIGIAFVIRLVGLDNFPPGFNWDEVSHGYNAYSIFKTSSDEWGKFLPLTNFRAYGDYPLPLNLYVTVPSIAVFGLNTFATRLPSALFGAATVIVVYFLAKRLFDNPKIGLLAASLLALSPWSFFTSRQVLQANPATFLYCLGILLVLKGIEEKKQWLIAGVASIGLSAYAYHNTRILFPVVLGIFALVYFRHLWQSKKIVFTAGFLALVMALPIAFAVLSKEGTARAAWVGILDQGAINSINEARNTSQLPQPLPKVVHNKITFVLQKSGQNYLSYYTPQFLGLFGGSHYQFSVPHFGVINMVEVPFFYGGLFLLLYYFKSESKKRKLLLSLLIIGPLPAAITKEPYQVVRAMTMMPFVAIISAFGIYQFFMYLQIKARILLKFSLFVFGFLFTAWLSLYMYNYWITYPKTYSFAWQYGYQQVAQYVQDNEKDYEQVVITKYYGEPHEFMLFFWQYDPLQYRNDPSLVRYGKSDWFWVDGFGKYTFMNDWEIKNNLAGQSSVLLVTSPGNYPDHATRLNTIYLLNGEPAFDIVKL